MIRTLSGALAAAVIFISGGCSGDAPKEGDSPVAAASRDASELGARATQKDAKFGGGPMSQGPSATRGR